jgi:hypothetical protein
MKMKLEGIPGEPGKWLLGFDLVDNRGNVHSSHEYETSGDLESEIPLDSYSKGRQIQLVPKINKYHGQLTIDGRDFRGAIRDRAQEIGYPKDADPLY